MSNFQKLCQIWQYVNGSRRLKACLTESYGSDRYRLRQIDCMYLTFMLAVEMQHQLNQSAEA